MLVFVDSNRIAHQLLDARALSQQLPPFSTALDLSVDDAYLISKCIMDLRSARGERLAGKKSTSPTVKSSPVLAPTRPCTARSGHLYSPAPCATLSTTRACTV